MANDMSSDCCARVRSSLSRQGKMMLRAGGITLRRPMRQLPVMSSRLAWVLVLVAVALAVARIVSTYPNVSETFDEPAHISSGMEWLDRGTYTYDLLHPP